MDARSQHDEHDTMAPAAMVEQLLTEIAPTTTPRKGRNLPGVGTIYRRGRVWWIKYSVHGKRLRESSKSTRESDAIRLLRTRIEECGKGRRRDPVAESRVRMSELFAALVADYQENGRRSAATLAFRLAPLREAFGQDRAFDVTTARIVRYRQERLAAGKAPATVNRELAALRRAFSLAVEQERLSIAPRVRLLEENNVREGFTTPDAFTHVTDELRRTKGGHGDMLADLAWFSYLVGWRRSEPPTLQWSEIDYHGRRLRLRATESKNKTARYLPYGNSPMLCAIIERRWQARAAAGDGAVFVFHRNGQRIRDFRGAWDGACERAGVPDLLFHDLRRSSVNNLTAAKVPPKVAMRITGHKTMATFLRYHIVTDDDVQAALEQTDAAISAVVAAAVEPTSAPLASEATE